MATYLSNFTDEQKRQAIAGGTALGSLNVPGLSGYKAENNTTLQTLPTTQTTQPTQKVKPVTSLSTTSGKNTYQGLVDQLNKIKEGLATLETTEEAPQTNKIPTATFTNAQGQTAIYNQAQLNDPQIQQMLRSGGFVMSSTEGPTLEAGELSGADRQIENLANEIKNYNVENDPAFASKAKEISDKYARMKEEMKQVNYQREKAVQTLGFRYGTTQYGGGVQMGIEGEELNQANQRLRDIDIAEQTEINAAREAMMTGKYATFYKTMEALEKTRTAKKEALETYNKTIGENLKKIEEQRRMVQRDSAIAELINSGYTETADVMELLNNMGGSFTAKEVEESLKALTGDKNANLDKFSGDVRDFLMLKQQFPEMLPEGIDNPFKYKQYMTQATKTLSSTGSGAIGAPFISGAGRGTPNTLSLSDPDTIRSLPVSTITKAVMSGMAKVKDLTPTDKAKVLSEMYEVGFNPNNYIINKLNGLIALYAAIPEEKKGPVEAYIKPQYFLQDPTIDAFTSAREVLTREIARLNDVGMLSDQDVASYSRAMPARSDASLANTIAKVAGLTQSITQQSVPQNSGQSGTLKDGRQFIISYDGKSLLDPQTGRPLLDNKTGEPLEI